MLYQTKKVTVKYKLQTEELQLFHHLPYKLAYLQRRERIPTNDKEISHMCGEILCINPHHLVAETHQLNMQSQMSNSNNDKNYQYINQQTTYTFRNHDQYRSWTLDKRHRQTVHNQTLTLHTAHQSELSWSLEHVEEFLVGSLG